MIAATAAVMNLLSVAAAYGILALFLEGGWAGNLIGIDSPAPMAAYVPVIMFALLFGLSMDYEVFLVSRMSETWVRTRDNNRSILAGLAGTGRVITAAASIMIVVFASLIALPDVTMKSFGVGMTAAVLVDATVVRMLLVPAVMGLLGRRQLVATPARRGLAAEPARRRPARLLPAHGRRPAAARCPGRFAGSLMNLLQSRSTSSSGAGSPRASTSRTSCTGRQRSCSVVISEISIRKKIVS